MTEPNPAPKPSPPRPPDSQWIGIHVSRKTFLIINVALALPYFLLAWFMLAQPEWLGKLFAEKKPAAVSSAVPAPPGQELRLKSGPWGRLEYVPIYLECPEEFLNVRSYEAVDRRWFFKGYPAEVLVKFIAGLSVSEDQRRELSDQAKWNITPAGIYLDPSRELRLSLAPAARRQLYPVLSEFSDIFKPIAIPANLFEEHFEQSGLAPETIALVRQLCYSHGSRLFLSDVALVMDTLEEYADRIRLTKTLSRKNSLLLNLHVAPGDDLNALVRYWAKAPVGKDVKPLLESLSKVPGGARVSVLNLLPPLIRAQLNTFPQPSNDVIEFPRDCHWTSLNFFNDPPEPKFGDPKFASETLRNEYHPVVGDPAYGDIVCFFRPNGGIIHSAVFIADDVVYTKNGPHYLQPWMLMRLSDLAERYTAVIPENEKLTVRYFRNKLL
ncbi:MAG: hypothetical protein HZA89_01575 [Verrucomicrobia bacterium]|nr:hypothetical protein [Verrucomicrobiota bacterium]